MKKNYFLTLLLSFVTYLSFGQTTILQETFETGNTGVTSETCNDGFNDFFTRTDGSDISSSYSVTGQEGSFFFAAMDIDGDCSSATQTLEFNDIDITGATNLNLAILLAEDDDGSSQDWDTSDSFLIEYDIDNSGTYTTLLAVSGTGTNTEPLVDGTTPLTSVFTEFIKSISATGSEIDIRLTFTLNSGDEDIAIDNIRLIDGTVTSPPSLAISSPSNNTTFAPGTTSVDVAISVSNFNVATGGTGDGYIQYTVNSGTAVDKFDTTDIALTGLTSGDYTVNIELVDNSGTALSPAVSASVDFSIASITQVSNLMMLRSGTEGNYYEVTGEVILTYIRSSRNQKYIQDATAGILIDDDSGVITTTYNTYDGITNLRGRLSSFGGVLQLIPSEDSGAATSTGNTITPEVVTLADFEANAKNYESELIKIENVSFTDAGATFETSRNYEITSGSTTSNFRTNFSEADYIGTTIPSGSVDMTVLGSSFTNSSGTTNQIVAIDLAGLVLGVVENEIDGFAAYPNPINGKSLTITSSSIDNKKIQIFNMIGKEVYQTSISGTNNRIDVSGVSSGMYILKVVEANKTATQKLIIK